MYTQSNTTNVTLYYRVARNSNNEYRSAVTAETSTDTSADTWEIKLTFGSPLYKLFWIQIVSPQKFNHLVLGHNLLSNLVYTHIDIYEKIVSFFGRGKMIIVYL